MVQANIEMEQFVEEIDAKRSINIENESNKGTWVLKKEIQWENLTFEALWSA